jgi:hypothetical protein
MGIISLSSQEALFHVEGRALLNDCMNLSSNSLPGMLFLNLGIYDDEEEDHLPKLERW